MKLSKIKSFQNRLIQDSFWALLGNVMSKGLALLAGILVARFLGKDLYGELGIVRNTILSFAIFSTFGLGYTATKYIAKYRESNSQKLYLTVYYSRLVTLGVSGVLGAILFIGAEYFATHVLLASHLSTIVRVLAILIVINALITLQIGILSGLGRFKEMAKINSIIGIFTFIVSVILTYFFSLNGAILGLLLTQILNFILNTRLVNRYVLKNKVVKDLDYFKEVMYFTIPVALQEAVFSLAYWLSTVLLVKYSSYGELGLYTATLQWNSIILFIPGILRNVVLSHLSTSEDNAQNHSELMKQTLKINFFATLVPALVVFLLSGFITSFYGSSFVELKLLLHTSVLITIFASISNVYAQAYMSKGMNWEMLIFRLLRDMGVLGLFMIFIYNNRSESKYLIMSYLILNIVFAFLMVIYYRFRTNRMYK